MNALAGFSPPARALIVAAAIAIVLLSLQAAASIVAPILLGPEIAENPDAAADERAAPEAMNEGRVATQSRHEP